MTQYLGDKVCFSFEMLKLLVTSDACLFFPPSISFPYLQISLLANLDAHTSKAKCPATLYIILVAGGSAVIQNIHDLR